MSHTPQHPHPDTNIVVNTLCQYCCINEALIQMAKDAY